MRLKWNFMTRVWIALMAFFAYAGCRERDTFPLRWSGYPVAIPASVKIAAAIAVIGICIFAWAANQRR
jgi:hypothetical protein